MPNIFQIRTVFSGFTGAPGYNQMYFDASGSTLGPQSASDAVRAFWDAVVADTPTGFKFAIDADVSELNDSTGALVDVHPTVPLLQSTFPTTANYAGGVGSVVKWITNSVHFSKRLTGRTFIVPLNSNSYDADGTLSSTAVNRARTAATTLIGHADFGVWGRPVGGVNGLFANATATNTRDHVAMLRTRRD